MAPVRHSLPRTSTYTHPYHTVYSVATDALGGVGLVVWYTYRGAQDGEVAGSVLGRGE